VINWATRGGPNVEAAQLGDLTVSMLTGEQGRQRKEIRKLVRWLRQESKPESSICRTQCCWGWPAKCGGWGFQSCVHCWRRHFLEKLVEPFYSQARAELRARSNDVDAFVAMNQYYADYMIDYLEVPTVACSSFRTASISWGTAAAATPLENR